MLKNRPNILSIAGLDPSGGAGLTADIKTMESLRCYGFSIASANTIQNDTTFHECHWVSMAILKKQIDVLWDRFPIEYVKIGIIENWSVLKHVVDYLMVKNPKVKIILDPVLKSSSDYTFHTATDSVLLEVLPKLYLITPNRIEIESLFADLSVTQTLQLLSSNTNVLLKGGHYTESVGEDILYFKSGEKQHLLPKSEHCYPKHGSGCVLSSAITSYLALGFSLLEAVKMGKTYIETFLNSNESLLGYHG